MYDFDWHRMHREKTERSAKLTLSIIRDIFDVDSILDIGCGDGIWLKTSRTLGFSVCKGIDGPWTKMEDLQIPKEDIKIGNLENRFEMGRRFDLAISLEVAEHIKNESSDIMVDNLTQHSDLLLFGAAIPYQGGFRHINEMWQSWWADKFAERGYRYFDVVRPQIWHRNDVHYWYKQNALLYVNTKRSDHIETVENYIRENSLNTYPLNLVHPEKYEDIASYSQIAFKPLLRKLPSRLTTKMKDVLLRRI
ncbi:MULTISPECIES: methyltransferase domain-containing protein [Methylobacterium]|uniref:methyltransferase domain-containing protein n=1 Tax=Methylobacterium TaxID=407 RepID=UPI000B095829|nr:MULTISPECIES: methyltransferase domain-containing protein [Methylobacterium]MCI9880225.1 methyltransferase domain-containing protein [Methylobacterium goesingense]